MEDTNEVVDFTLKRKRKKRNKKIKAALIAVVAAACVFNVFFGYDKVKESKTIVIEDGSSIFEIADTLKSEGILSKKIKFFAMVVLSGNKGNLKSGTFEFEKGMNCSEVIDTLVNKGISGNTIMLTIPEGFSVENIITRMAENGFGTEEEIKAALEKDYDFEFLSHVPKKDGQKYRLQGFLYPSTYEFYKNAVPEDVIKTLLGEFEKQYKKLSGNTENVYEIITKASLIEREARLDSERAAIAGVIENRLKQGMKLQIDATVAYAMSGGKYDVERVMYKDLKLQSPYNTYFVTGLPIGPIANPGKNSIEAALHPEKNEYLYYHTDETKKDGSHIFTKTYEEHSETMR